MILIIVVKKIKHFNQNASIFSIINLIHDFNYCKKINKKLSIYRLKSVVVKKPSFSIPLRLPYKLLVPV